MLQDKGVHFKSFYWYNYGICDQVGIITEYYYIDGPVLCDHADLLNKTCALVSDIYCHVVCLR